MNVLRRHRILAADVRRVIGHLRAHKKITKNDIITRPRLKKKKGLPDEEPIPWAHAELKGSWQGADLKPGPNGVHQLYTKEGGTWKLVVPEEDVDKYMRKALLSKDSKMPHGRDSAYHHIHKATATISRRRMYAFLEKQGILQVTKNIPNESKKGGIFLKKRGYLEMDLIEGQGIDLYKYFGPRGNWYWLSVVDVFTGYGVVALSRTKTAAAIAKKLDQVLNVMEHKLGAKATQISADHGREFFAEVRVLLKKRRIKMKQVPKGSRVEKFNQDFQRNFYRLLRMRRGNFTELQKQALDLTNNTRNKNLKMTPEEALSKPDAQLVGPYAGGREAHKKFKGKAPKVGDKCRYLIKMRKNIRPILKIGSKARTYKSYLGQHFSKQVHKITKIINQRTDDDGNPTGPPNRYLVDGTWRHRDQILLVSGTDSETDAQIARRNA